MYSESSISRRSPVAVPGPGAPGAPGALLGGRFADPGDLEARSCPMAVQHLLLGSPGIHHIPDTWNQSYNISVEAPFDLYLALFSVYAS